MSLSAITILQNDVSHHDRSTNAHNPETQSHTVIDIEMTHLEDLTELTNKKKKQSHVSASSLRQLK